MLYLVKCEFTLRSLQVQLEKNENCDGLQLIGWPTSRQSFSALIAERL